MDWHPFSGHGGFEHLFGLFQSLSEFVKRALTDAVFLGLGEPIGVFQAVRRQQVVQILRAMLLRPSASLLQVGRVKGGGCQQGIRDEDLKEFVEFYEAANRTKKRKEFERFKRFTYADLRFSWHRRLRLPMCTQKLRFVASRN